jgi:hypothetical protein
MSEHREDRQPGEHAEFDREIGTRSVVKTGLWLAGGTAVSMALAGLLLVGIAALERKSDPPPNPMADEIKRLARLGFPGPQLQAAPTVDMAALRHAEDKVLGSYGWVSQENGVARVPISRAMEMLLARSAAAATAAAPPAGSAP